MFLRLALALLALELYADCSYCASSLSCWIYQFPYLESLCVEWNVPNMLSWPETSGIVTLLQASNSVGQSQFSKEALYMTEVSVPAAPEAPTLLSASATSMTVEWQVA